MTAFFSFFNLKYGPIFYPRPLDIEHFHEVIIAQRGIRGYESKGLIEGSVEWAMTNVYSFKPFPDLSLTAAAIMYALTTFHPYVDGNKRTALMTTAFFVGLNGYYFQIPPDAPEFARDLASRTLDDPEHSPSKEIKRVARWIVRRIGRSFSSRLKYAYMVRASDEWVRGEPDIYVDDTLINENEVQTWINAYAMILRVFLRKESEEKLDVVNW